MSEVLSMILAGGEGSRLYPLTELRAKPAVPFGGSYRIIDFVLNNFVNSELFKIFVLTQFKSHSLMKHLRQGWRVSGFSNMFIDPIPAQMQTGRNWYQGTADAIFQNLHLFRNESPEMVCVFGGDHIYKMDIQQMLRFHRKRKAVLTVAAIPVPIADAHHFGIIEVDENWRMIGFQEKPRSNPTCIPGDPTRVLASMGNYIFKAGILKKILNEDAENPESSHDFGKDIIPTLYPAGEVFVYDFFQNHVPGVEGEEHGYWRDVGTIDSYWESNMNLVGVNPVVNLYNRQWPLNTYYPPLPPAKFVHYSDLRTGHAINSMVAQGTIVSGSLIENSILGFGTRIHSFSHIVESVVMDHVVIHRGVKIRKAIIDKNVEIAPGVEIGYNLEADRAKFHVSEGGIVVIPKGAKVE